ncbi:MAG: hypothetical protein EPN82_11860 [Bacteroidetes bacterium]|nr:MAG: hypothetical protein EPN82_11860 [Bacteroidota bacterium]
MNRILEIFLLCIVLPITMNVIIYFCFSTHYTHYVFSESSFSRQYDHGIYKYRILSKYMLLELHKIINKNIAESEPKDFLKVLDTEGTNNFYAAYFVLNTFFSIMFALLVYMLLFNFKFLEYLNNYDKLISFLNINLLMYISQYVFVPYDISGYTFLILSVILTLFFLEQKKNIYLLIFCFVLILSTLNREVSYVSLAFYAAFFITVGNLKDNIKNLIVPILCFILTYLLLRIYFGFEHGWIEGIQNNFTPKVVYKSLPVLIFGTGFIYLLIKNTVGSINQKLMRTFLILNTPYFITFLIGGRWIELRLFIPIFFGLIILSKMNPDFIGNISESKAK